MPGVLSGSLLFFLMALQVPCFLSHTTTHTFTDSGLPGLLSAVSSISVIHISIAGEITRKSSKKGVVATVFWGSQSSILLTQQKLLCASIPKASGARFIIGAFKYLFVGYYARVPTYLLRRDDLSHFYCSSHCLSRFCF